MNTDLIVTSPAFDEGSVIPIRYTGRGEDVSPELNISNIDERAVSIAIALNDRDHPIRGYNHWVIWNIPVMETIPENIPHGEVVTSLGGAVQGRGYGKHGYRGPKPPFNWSHLYEFDVYVLDTMLNLDSKSGKKDLLNAMSDHVLQQATLTGRFR